MATIHAIIVVDGDGVVQHSTAVDMDGLCTDAGLVDVIGGIPVLVCTSDDIDPRDMSGYRAICPVAMTVSEPWIAVTLLRRVAELADGFGIGTGMRCAALLNDESYRDVLDMEQDIRLHVISPSGCNCGFSHRTWEPSGSGVPVFSDGVRYVITEYARKGGLDLDEDMLLAEIEGMEHSLNAKSETLNSEEERSIDRLAAVIVDGWKLGGGCPDDDDGREWYEDDGCLDGCDTCLLDRSETDDLYDTVDMLGGKVADMASTYSIDKKDILVRISTAEHGTVEALSGVRKVNEFSMQICKQQERLLGRIARTRRSVARTVYGMRRMDAELDSLHRCIRWLQIALGVIVMLAVMLGVAAAALINCG